MHSVLFQKHMPNVSVYTPSYIKQVSPNEYDTIIIAMADKKERENVRLQLVQWGVPEAKIVSDIKCFDEIVTLDTPRVKAQTKYTFSWFGEDLIVKGIFEMLGIKNPTYLDIGCNHPYDGNNTAFLYLTGSRGISIDANQKCIDLMNAERPDDVNICMGVLEKPGEFDFLIIDELSGLNTFSQEYLEQYKRNQSTNDSVSNIISVRCETLETIIEKYCGNVFPDFFDLDIEGMDEAVMLSYNFENNGPKVICVETHDNGVVQHMLNQGYVRYFSTVHNSIFVQKKLMNKIIIG